MPVCVLVLTIHTATNAEDWRETESDKKNKGQIQLSRGKSAVWQVFGP